MSIAAISTPAAPPPSYAPPPSQGSKDADGDADGSTSAAAAPRSDPSKVVDVTA
jgi:hypothetical protein